MREGRKQVIIIDKSIVRSKHKMEELIHNENIIQRTKYTVTTDDKVYKPVVFNDNLRGVRVDEIHVHGNIIDHHGDFSIRLLFNQNSYENNINVYWS